MRPVLFIALLFVSGSMFAQCVPNAPSNSQGVYPPTLDQGYIQTQYSDTLTIVYPVDTVFSGFTIPFDSFRVDLVNNLPLGLNYVCNDANCVAVAPGGSLPATECIEITGVPTTIPTNDSIELSITAYATLFGNPQAISGIIQKVELPMSSVTVGVNDLSNNLALSLFPNPSNGLVSIQSSERLDNVTVDVKNVLGQMIHTSVFRNTNLLTIELPETSGTYVIEVKSSDGRKAMLKAIRE